MGYAWQRSEALPPMFAVQRALPITSYDTVSALVPLILQSRSGEKLLLN